MDVTDKSSITAAVQVVEEKSGKLDILVNKYSISNSHNETLWILMKL